MNKENDRILSQSVQFIRSVGPKRAEAFKSIGIKTIKDLLFYFPSRHLDRTNILTASKAYGYLVNNYDGELTIIATVYEKEKIRFGKKEIFKVQFRDQTGFFECVWYQGIKFFQDRFNEGEIFAVSGKPTLSKYGNMQFVHPDFDRITEEESQNLHNTGKIIPFYRIPKELKNKNIGDFSLRKIINSAVENYANLLSETLPENIIAQNKLVNIVDAVKNFHYPESKEKLDLSVKRLKYEELFYLETLVALRKHNYKTKQSGHSFQIQSNLV